MKFIELIENDDVSGCNYEKYFLFSISICYCFCNFNLNAGNSKAVKVLLENGANPNTYYKYDISSSHENNELNFY